MVLVVLYAGVGIYLAILAFGLVHRAWWAKIDPYTRSNVRTAVSILAVGSLALAIYHAHLYSEFRAEIKTGREQGAPQIPGEQGMPTRPSETGRQF